MNDLKRDILKTLGKGQSGRTFTLRGVNNLDGEDMASLLSLCNLYDNEGEISEPWKEKITRTRIAEVLVKYQMW